MDSIDSYGVRFLMRVRDKTRLCFSYGVTLLFSFNSIDA